MDSDTQQTPYGWLPSSLCGDRLADLCLDDGVQTGPFGSQLHQEDYVPIGTPIITVEHLGENRIVHQDLPRVTDEDRQRLAKYSLKTGDIVFSRVGSVDRRAIVRESENGWLFSGRCLRVRPDPEKLDSQWLSYFFGLPAFKQYIRGIAVGATMPSINTKILSDVPIYFPALTEQRSAAKCLTSIDDKIDLNRRINQTLEAMAQAIFKSWFVDFDPVKAKIAAKQEGRDPLRAAMSAISGKPEDELDALLPEQYEQLAATAALFPDEMNESELGEIPRGWTTAVLSDTAEVIMGQSPDGDTYNDSGDGMALINGPVEFDSYHPKRIKWTTQPTKTSQPGDLIVCVRGSTTGKFVKSDGIYCLGRGVCAIRAQEPSWQPFVDQTYKFSLTALLSLATGSTFPNWSGPTLKNYRILQPQPDVIVAYSLLVQSVISQISTNDLENKSLSSIRDTLLPKLLSGELPFTEFTVEAEA